MVLLGQTTISNVLGNLMNQLLHFKVSYFGSGFVASLSSLDLLTMVWDIKAYFRFVMVAIAYFILSAIVGALLSRVSHVLVASSIFILLSAVEALFFLLCFGIPDSLNAFFRAFIGNVMTSIFCDGICTNDFLCCQFIWLGEYRNSVSRQQLIQNYYY
jgi:hypothetical protein